MSAMFSDTLVLRATMLAIDMKGAAIRNMEQIPENKGRHGGYHRRSLDERIHELDVMIAATLKLQAQRDAIVRRDQETLAKHQASLVATKEKLAQLSSRRERLVEERDNPLSKEEKAQLRAQRKDEAEKLDHLLLKLKQSGITLDDLLDELSSKEK